MKGSQGDIIKEMNQYNEQKRATTDCWDNGGFKKNRTPPTHAERSAVTGHLGCVLHAVHLTQMHEMLRNS